MECTKFGTTKTGTAVTKYILENKQGLRVAVTDFGAALVSIWMKDKNGTEQDVLLGYDTAEEYEACGTNFGFVIGRNANRIAGAMCKIGDVDCKLEVNDGKNNLHTGKSGFQNKVWKAEFDSKDSTRITFSVESPDMEQGFPGNVKFSATYELTEENELILKYHGTTDRTTILNPTNHAYFNLSGHNSGTIDKQQLRMHADAYMPADEELIPTGEIRQVENTAFDFRTFKTFGQDFFADDIQLKNAGGYDHNFMLAEKPGSCSLAAEAFSEETGIHMNLYTDRPGVQLYCANQMSGEKGKQGMIYGARSGFCLEPQFPADAIHKSQFPSPLWEAGKEYVSENILKFWVK